MIALLNPIWSISSNHHRSRNENPTPPQAFGVLNVPFVYRYTFVRYPGRKANTLSVNRTCVLTTKSTTRANLYNIIKIISSKIARESPTAECEGAAPPDAREHEWRRLVGSIRRRVQRHGSSTERPDVPAHQRKNSLTQVAGGCPGVDGCAGRLPLQLA